MHKITRYLKYSFTEDEIDEQSKSLARETVELQRLENDKKAVTSDFNAKIAAAKARQEEFANHINTGFEMRNVDCRVDMNEPKTGKKTITRLDTGEVVEVVNMTEEERQGNLFDAKK